MTARTDGNGITAPTDEELAMAERLAQLFGGDSTTASALDAVDVEELPVLECLDTAEMISASRRTELDKTSLQSVLGQVEQRIEGARVRRVRTRFALMAGSVLAAAAAVMLAVFPQSQEAPEPAAVPNSESMTAKASDIAELAFEAGSEAVLPGAAGGRITQEDSLREAQRVWLDEPSSDNQVELTARVAECRSNYLAMLRRRYTR